MEAMDSHRRENRSGVFEAISRHIAYTTSSDCGMLLKLGERCIPMLICRGRITRRKCMLMSSLFLGMIPSRANTDGAVLRVTPGRADIND
jgi:hypothetical protein